MKTDVSQTMSLISRIHTSSADFLTAKLIEKGLPNFSTSHGFILFQLSQSGALSMGELASRVNRDKSTLTALIRKLQQEGFVKVTENENDKRSRIITLTEKGKTYNEATSQLSSELLAKFFHGFTKHEQKQLCEYLERIKENFDNY